MNKSNAELDRLRKLLTSLEALVNFFSSFRGENPRCDLLLQNLGMLLQDATNITRVETANTKIDVDEIAAQVPHNLLAVENQASATPASILTSDSSSGSPDRPNKRPYSPPNSDSKLETASSETKRTRLKERHRSDNGSSKDPVEIWDITGDENILISTEDIKCNPILIPTANDAEDISGSENRLNVPATATIEDDQSVAAAAYEPESPVNTLEPSQPVNSTSDAVIPISDKSSSPSHLQKDSNSSHHHHVLNDQNDSNLNTPNQTNKNSGTEQYEHPHQGTENYNTFIKSLLDRCKSHKNLKTQSKPLTPLSSPSNEKTVPESRSDSTHNHHVGSIPDGEDLEIKPDVNNLPKPQSSVDEKQHKKSLPQSTLQNTVDVKPNLTGILDPSDENIVPSDSDATFTGVKSESSANLKHQIQTLTPPKTEAGSTQDFNDTSGVHSKRKLKSKRAEGDKKTVAKRNGSNHAEDNDVSDEHSNGFDPLNSDEENKCDSAVDINTNTATLCVIPSGSKNKQNGSTSPTAAAASGDQSQKPLAIKTAEPESLIAANVRDTNKILQNIFKYLNVKDLKSCRMASRLCNLEATKLIRTLPIRPLEITSSSVKFKKFVVCLQEFSCFIGTSTMFPCYNFKVIAASLGIDSVRNFFTAYGSIVEAVEISNLNYVANDEESTIRKKQNLMEEFLAKQLPNLRVLELPKSHKLNIFPESSTPQLLKLQELILSGSGKIESQFLSKLLKSAINLKFLYCKNLTVLDLKLFLQLKVMHLVKFFKFDFSRSNIELYDQIAQHSPEFRRLDNILISRKLPSSLWPIFGEILVKCFASSSESLRSIDNFYPLGHVPTLKLPILPNVAYLRLFYKEDWLNLKLHGSPVPMFPRGSNLMQIFPNLNNVKISFDNSIFEALQPADIFPAIGSPIVSVKELIVWYTCDEEDEEGVAAGIPTVWIKYFCEMFPNLSVAYFEFVQDFSSAGEYVWKLQDLEELTLEIELNDKVNFNPFPGLDSSFTGFCHEKVKELYQQLPEDIQISEEDVKALRFKPSIVDLHRLRKLSISFIDWRSVYNGDNIEKFSQDVKKKKTDAESLFKNNVILSHVTGLFGFRMCPQLNDVKIKLGASQWYNKHFPFKTLQPYVPRIPFTIRS